MRANARIVVGMQASTHAAHAAPAPISVRDTIRAGAAVSGPSPIPAVPGLPLLGSALAFRKHRLALMSRVASMGPVARYDLGPVPIHVVSDAALAHEMLVEQPDAFIKSRGLSVFLRPLLGDGLLT